MNDPILEVADLRTYFRADGSLVKAVDGVSFDVAPGEVVGIVGESGSGKSVTSLSIMRLVPEPPGYSPSGSITFAGVDLMRASERTLQRLRGDRIAMVFQDPMTSLNPYLTIERQLTEVLEWHRKMSRREARMRATAMLERVGLPDAERRLYSYPHEFSGGMRQRVMIAMALLCEPQLLIADEPTTALDVTIQAQILELLRGLRAELKMSVILITHDLGVVAGMADRVLVMYAGRIVEAAATDRLFATPRHPYTQGLLRCAPRLDGPRGAALVPIPGMPPDLSALPSGCPFRTRCSVAGDRCAEEYPPQTEIDSGYVHCWAHGGPS